MMLLVSIDTKSGDPRFAIDSSSRLTPRDRNVSWYPAR